jgi:hypothetical protein
MAVYNLGDAGIGVVRVILASCGIFAANMVDIDAMGTLMTGDLAMGKRNPGLQHTAQYGVLRTRHRTGTLHAISSVRGTKLAARGPSFGKPPAHLLKFIQDAIPKN